MRKSSGIACALVLIGLSALACGQGGTTGTIQVTSGTASHVMRSYRSRTVPLAAPPASLAPELIARAFQYPGTLRMRAETERDRRGPGGVPLWAVAFASEANTFAPVEIIGFQGGTLLKPEVEAAFVSMDNKWQQEIERKQTRIAQSRAARQRVSTTTSLASAKADEPPIEILDGSWGSKAYVSVSGIGPGGGAYMFLSRSPDSKLDLMIQLGVFVGDGGHCPVDSDATHGYYEQAVNCSVSMLANAGTQIAAELFKK